MDTASEQAASEDGREGRANVAAKFNLGPILFPRTPKERRGKEERRWMDGWMDRWFGQKIGAGRLYDLGFVISET